jgi:hypothetical protein
MKDIKIEKGIPLPVRVIDVLSKMDFGDSLVIDVRELTLFHNTYRYYKKKGLHLNYKIVTRKVEGGYRIWKVKKDEHES